MSLPVWIGAVLTLLTVDTLAIAHLITRGLHQREPDAAWFDHERFQAGLCDPIAGVRDRINAARGVIVHPCSYGGDLIEYPLCAGWNENDVLATLAEIEVL